MANITWRNVNSETTDSSGAYFKLAEVLNSMGSNLSKAIGSFDQARKENTNSLVASRIAMANTPEQLANEKQMIVDTIPVNLLTKEAIAGFGARQKELDDVATASLNMLLAKNRDSREESQLGLQREQAQTQKEQFNKTYGLNVKSFNENARQFEVTSNREDTKLNINKDQFAKTFGLEKTNSEFDNNLKEKTLNQKITEEDRQFLLDTNEDSRAKELHSQKMEETKAAFNQAEVSRADADVLAMFQNALATTPTYQEAIATRNSVEANSKASPIAVAAMNSAINSKFGIPDITIPTGNATLESALNNSDPSSSTVSSYGDINPSFNSIPVKVSDGSTKSMSEVINQGNSEFSNGGSVKLGTQALLTGIASSLGSNLHRVTAGNDRYHQDKTKVGYQSKHQVGDAFDVTVNDISYSDALTKVKDNLSAQGLVEGDYKVLHEKGGQGASTSEHIHVELTKSGLARMDAKVSKEIANIQLKPRTNTAKDVATMFVDLGKQLEILKKQASDANSLTKSQVPSVSMLKSAVPDGNRMGYASEVVKALSSGMDLGEKDGESYRNAIARFNEFSASIESSIKADGITVDPANVAAAILHTTKSDTDLSRWLSIAGNNFKDVRLDFKGAKETAISLQQGHFDAAIKDVDNYVSKVGTVSTEYAVLDKLAKEVQKFKSAANQGVPNAARAYTESLNQFNSTLAGVTYLTSEISKAPPRILTNNAKAGTSSPVLNNKPEQVNYLTGKPITESDIVKAKKLNDMIGR